MPFLLFLIFSFAFLFSHAQNPNTNFSAVDIRALNIPVKVSENIDTLAFYLTSVYETDIEKARSIFRWVANNIKYDFNKQVAVFKNENDFSQDAQKVFKNKKAVCEGYSNLFFDLCKRSGLTAEVVTGYARPDGKGEPQTHAWNAVKINNQWKLLDATWAAGGIDEKKNAYRKSFDSTFFLMDANTFIISHYPLDPMWQLLQKPLTYTEFMQKKKPVADFVFAFNDTIKEYYDLYKADSLKALQLQNQRMLRYYPENLYAETTLKDIAENMEVSKFEEANALATSAIALYNETIAIVNTAKRKKTVKLLNDKEVFVTSNIGSAKEKLNSAMEIYISIKFTSGINKINLDDNKNMTKRNLKLVTDLHVYLEKFFKTPVAKRMFVL